MNWWEIHGTLSPLSGCERTTAILKNGNGRGNAKKRVANISINTQHPCKTAKGKIILFQAPVFGEKKVMARVLHVHILK